MPDALYPSRYTQPFSAARLLMSIILGLMLSTPVAFATEIEDEEDVAAEAQEAAEAGDADASGEPLPEASTTPEMDNAPAPETATETGPVVKAFHLLEKSVEPGQQRTLYWTPSSALNSLETPVPVQVAHGNRPGPRLCLTSAVHGDELNGIEIVRRIMQSLDPQDLSGTVIGVPIVNLDGFRRASRYVSDRRDLNRHFPGTRHGSLASRMAHSFFHSVITSCDYLVDIHTGSFHRTNLPQLRANLQIPGIIEFTKGFGGIVVVQDPGESGTLRRAADKRNIPAVTLETGGPLHLEKEAVDWGVKGIENLLHSLDMKNTLRLWTTPQPVYFKTRWVRAQQGGLLFSEVELNDVLDKGQLMGRVTDPITNTSSEIRAPYKGRVVGMAFDQVVSPGFAAYHLGMEAPASEISGPPAPVTSPVTSGTSVPGEAQGGMQAVPGVAGSIVTPEVQKTGSDEKHAAGTKPPEATDAAATPTAADNKTTPATVPAQNTGAR